MEAVEQMGLQLAKRGHSLVFGAGRHGLMGAVARGTRKGGGKILGVVPKFFGEMDVEILYPDCDELIQPDTMRQRKQIMEENADAFVMVPGGIGTFEEFFEILTARQLCLHNKPIAIYNVNNYYTQLDRTIRVAMEQGFVQPEVLDLYHLTDDASDLFR
jgi:uncharacterized protein (TIGR00730 family)